MCKFCMWQMAKVSCTWPWLNLRLIYCFVLLLVLKKLFSGFFTVKIIIIIVLQQDFFGNIKTNWCEYIKCKQNMYISLFLKRYFNFRVFFSYKNTIISQTCDIFLFFVIMNNVRAFVVRMLNCSIINF